MRRWTLILATAANAFAAQQGDLGIKSEKAKAYMAAGRFAEASELYAELTKAVPGNPGLLTNHGMALHLSGKDAEAIPILKAALKISPSHPPALMFLGASYLHLGQPANAIAPLSKFVAMQPDHLEARQMLVDAANLAGKPAVAIPHLEKLAELQPDKPAVWYELGRAYEAVAADTFSQMEKSFPESGPFFALLGETRSKVSQTRSAFFFYRKALAKTPTLRGVHTAIADIYRQTDHADWAATEEAAEKSLPPANCASRNAECEFLAGRYQSAFQLAKAGQSATTYYWRVRSAYRLSSGAFSKLEALPASPELFRYRAEKFRAANRHAEAAASWREGLRLAPGHPDFQRELAASLLAAREYDEAQKLLGPLLETEPGAADLNQLQGDLLLAQQLPEKAIPFLARACEADPSYLPGRAQLGRALLQAGRPSEAAPHLTAALPIDSDASLHFQLARAYQSSGDSTSARAAMVRYQEAKARVSEQDRVLEEDVQISPPSK